MFDQFFLSCLPREAHEHDHLHGANLLFESHYQIGTFSPLESFLIIVGINFSLF